MSVEFLTLSREEKYQYCPTPPPTPLSRDWRWWSLIIPSVATACGLFLFATLAIGFTELRNLPDSIRFLIVASGAILIPLGSELGTVSSVVEIFRKHFSVGASKLDWIGLVFSTLTSIAGVVMSWAYLLGADTGWSADVIRYGPLVFGTLMVLDFTFSLLETGAYLGRHDKEFDKWLRAKFIPWIEKKEERLDAEPQWAYNDVENFAENHWPAEPPIKPDDTPAQPGLNDMIAHADPDNGKDAVILHPAVARAISDD